MCVLSSHKKKLPNLYPVQSTARMNGESFNCITWLNFLPKRSSFSPPGRIPDTLPAIVPPIARLKLFPKVSFFSLAGHFVDWTS